MNIGSSGLIMENRPSSVPEKSIMEKIKHQMEYKKILKIAKSKDEQKINEINQRQQHIEESIAVWTEEIIPNWNSMRNTKKCRQLWSRGLPSCIRGVVWRLSIGDKLSLKSSGYELNTPRENPNATKEYIRMDVQRTFPHLGLFQHNKPLHHSLCHILETYASYHPNTGYVQGMSSVAAILFLNMDEEDAYVAFSNLLNTFPHNHFFSINEEMINETYNIYNELLQRILPTTYHHLQNLNVTPNMYLLDWMLTLFSSSTPLDVCSRLLDLYFRDGLIFLFQAAIGIVKHYDSVILSEDCVASCAQFLTRLPSDMNFDSFMPSIQFVQEKLNNEMFSIYYRNGSYVKRRTK